MNNSAIFYKNHKDKLFAYLMRMTGDYHLSSDIMQESFTRHFEHYGQEDTPSLLYTIARNTFFDHIRREKRSSSVENYQEECSADHERVLMAREEYRRVLLALQKLEEDERDVLSLVIGGDFSYREIAAISGISEANVKVKVHRSRLKLRKMLEGDENE
jgi:RNA polymerase sigma-70 factor (ECF subfamily)